MSLKSSFVICVLAICYQIVVSQDPARGYNYRKSNDFEIIASPQTAAQASHYSPQDLFLANSQQQQYQQQPHQQQQYQQQPLKQQQYQQQPHQQQQVQHQFQQQQQQSSNLGNNFVGANSQNFPFSQDPRNIGFQQASNQQSSFVQQQSNQFPQAQQGQYYTQAENSLRLEFRPVNTIQDNSIDDGVCLTDPIIGQFKPELVDLNNGGPLSRVITTCGPNQDCKSLALQSDLNRVLTLHPYQIHAPRIEVQHYRVPRPEGPHFSQGGQANGNTVNYKRASRRLFQYSEIPVDNNDFEHFN